MNLIQYAIESCRNLSFVHLATYISMYNYIYRGIGTAFLFGFFLLLLSAIFFFFGANSLKICQAVQGPDYELFAQVINWCINQFLIKLLACMQTIDRSEVREALAGASGNTTFSIRDIPSISGFFRWEDEKVTHFNHIIRVPSHFIDNVKTKILPCSLPSTLERFFHCPVVQLGVQYAVYLTLHR